MYLWICDMDAAFHPLQIPRCEDPLCALTMLNLEGYSIRGTHLSEVKMAFKAGVSDRGHNHHFPTAHRIVFMSNIPIADENFTRFILGESNWIINYIYIMHKIENINPYLDMSFYLGNIQIVHRLEFERVLRLFDISQMQTPLSEFKRIYVHALNCQVEIDQLMKDFETSTAGSYCKCPEIGFDGICEKCGTKKTPISNTPPISISETQTLTPDSETTQIIEHHTTQSEEERTTQPITSPVISYGPIKSAWVTNTHPLSPYSRFSESFRRLTPEGWNGHGYCHRCNVDLEGSNRQLCCKTYCGNLNEWYEYDSDGTLLKVQQQFPS